MQGDRFSRLGCFVFGILLARATRTNAVSFVKRLDLSYLHTVKTSSLLQAVRSALDREKELEIDLSSSLPGKHAADLVASIENASSATIQLTLRCNQWQPEEATMLLEAIVRNDTNGMNETDVQRFEKADNMKVQNETSDVGASDEGFSDGGFPTVASLDLGWNDLGGEYLPGSKSFLKSLQNLVASQSRCPLTLRLDICGLGPSACRALGKGIVNRYKNEATSSEEIEPISLHLARNPIGDAGAAALSAAIRIVNQEREALVFDVLDLSACGIGDSGAEALAITLESRPWCIRHLDLSNNHISDEGASAIGRALSSQTGHRGLETLDLSNNMGLGNSGASTIAQAIASGMIENLLIRSCHVQADGAAAFAKAIKALGTRKKNGFPVRKIDLSGNPLGVLRKQSKANGGKYSATALKSKASATTAAYINMIGSTVQKGLKEFGMAAPDPAESDDAEDGRLNEESEESDQDPSKAKCGALAFAISFMGEGGEERVSEGCVANQEGGIKPTLELGLRGCCLDSRAADALAAVVQDAKENINIDLTVDASMNSVLEDEMTNALRGDKSLEAYLSEMAERHLEAMEALRFAREKAMQASEAAAARVKAEARLEAAWGSAAEVGDDGDYEVRLDSDADYEIGVGEYDVDEEMGF